MALDVGAQRINKKRGKRVISLDDEDITIEILLRLPVRSLIRFRCVCKLWQSITHDPYFIDTHLERARKVPSILFYPVLSYNTKDPLGISHLDDDENTTPILPPPKPYCPRPTPAALLNGSCNGLLALLCITGDCRDEGESILLFNPSTRESLATPEPTKPYHTGSLHMGFHPVTKEYKVLRFFAPWPRVRCEVYTLGASSWRQLCTTLVNSPKGRPAAADGAMYWKSHEDDSLICFDLKDERLTWISLPNFNHVYPGREPTIEIHLVELQGSICLPVFTGVAPYEHNLRQVVPQMDLWVLVNHAHHHPATPTAPAAAEWTRKYSVILPSRSDIPIPLLIRNKKILMQYRTFKAKTEKKRGKRRELSASLLQYHHLEQDNKSSGNRSNGDGVGVGVVRDYNYIFHSYLHVQSLVPLLHP